MSAYLFQTQLAGNAGTDTFPVTISTTAGSAMAITICAWMVGNTPFSIASIEDSAGNNWSYSTSQNNQNPPAAGVWDAAANQYAFSAVAVCLPSDNGGTTKAVTSVTVTLTAAPSSWCEVWVSEITGVPSNATVLAGDSADSLAVDVTSYTTPSVTSTGAMSFAAIATSCYGEFTSATPAGWTILNSGGNTVTAVNVAPSGTVGATFTLAAAQGVPSSAILLVGVANPKAATLQDSFATDDLATLWGSSYGTVGVSGGRCSIQTDTSYSSGLGSSIHYDVTGSQVLARVTPYQVSSGQCGLQIDDDAGNKAYVQYSGGSVNAQLVQGGTTTESSSVAYDPTAHAWWRIREQSGTLFFETAPDGLTWTLLWSTAYTTLTATAAYIGVFAGNYGSDPTGTTYVTDVNIVPSPAAPPSMILFIGGC